MDERLLFERFHEALDVDPRPAAYERMRSALIKSTFTPRRRAAFHMRWTKMGFRLAAVIVLVAIGATVGAMFIATHRVAQQNIPAKLDAQTMAYQAIVGSDANAMLGSESGHCGTIADRGCPAALAKIKASDQKWLNDLDSFETVPASFLTADRQLHVHLATLISDIDAATAAFQAQNPDALARAIQAGGQESSWLSAMAVAVAHARPATAATYTASVRDAKTALDGCGFCQPLVAVSAASCAGPGYSSCDSDLTGAKQSFEAVQGDVVLNLAPGSLRNKDSKLQGDLAQADDALIALRKALRTADSAGWDSQRAIFGNSLTSVEQDINSIIGT